MFFDPAGGVSMQVFGNKDILGQCYIREFYGICNSFLNENWDLAVIGFCNIGFEI